MNIIVIVRFMRKDGTNGLNKKSVNRPDDNWRECKETIYVILEKKVFFLIGGCSVRVLWVKLINLFFKEDNLYQTSPARKSGKTMEIADKTTLRGRFSPSFYLKQPFIPQLLHPLE